MDYIFDSQYEVFMFNALQGSGLSFELHKKVSTGYGQDYIFDFVVYGKYAKVVVECDGEQHTFDAYTGHDVVRSLWAIQHGGYDDVLRFNNFQINDQLYSCLSEIHKRIVELDAALKGTKEPLDLQAIIPQRKHEQEIPYRPYKIQAQITTTTTTKKSEPDPLEARLSKGDFAMLLKLRDLGSNDKKLLWWTILNSTSNGFMIIIDSRIPEMNDLFRVKAIKIMLKLENRTSILVLPNNLRLLEFLKLKL